MSEQLLRIEHKLDVLINYLHGMTNVPPADMPKPLPRAGGLTNGLCPITNTPITYVIDAQSGMIGRMDGLTSGMPSSPSIAVPNPPEWARRNSEMGDISDADD